MTEKGPGAASYGRDIGAKRSNEESTTSPGVAPTLLKVIEHQLQQAGLELTSDKRVIELGSGTGSMLEEFRKRGISAVGFDVRPRGGPEGSQVEARIEALPLADASVDVAVSTSLFDPLEFEKQDQQAMLEEIARVLKEGGVYVSMADHINGEVVVEQLEKLPNLRANNLIQSYRKRAAESL